MHGQYARPENLSVSSNDSNGYFVVKNYLKNDPSDWSARTLVK